jgi:hypothetical protein
MVDGAEPTDDPLRVERANGAIPVWLATSKPLVSNEQNRDPR